jgi:hypothetical protein
MCKCETYVQHVQSYIDRYTTLKLIQAGDMCPLKLIICGFWSWYDLMIHSLRRWYKLAVCGFWIQCELMMCGPWSWYRVVICALWSWYELVICGFWKWYKLVRCVFWSWCELVICCIWCCYKLVMCSLWSWCLMPLVFRIIWNQSWFIAFALDHGCKIHN